MYAFDVWVALLARMAGVAVLGAAAAWGAFVWFGKRWVEQQFSRQLEILKHRQSEELEQQRFKINALFNRISKIHEREADVLPELWKLLQDALGHIASLTSSLKVVVDLDSISNEKLEEFLAGSRLSETDRSTVRKSVAKRETYGEIIFWYDLADAQDAELRYRNYFVRNSILLSSDLKSKFGELARFLQSALVDIRVSREAKDYRFVREAANALHTTTSKTIQEIEQLVQRRLRLDDA